jgi:PAS domain S-box-containing protein
MTWNYVYTSYFWPSLATVLFLLLLSAYSWQRRSVPGAALFAIGALFNVMWVTGNILENAAADPATRLFWFKFQGALLAPVAIPITCFILEYAWPGRWLTRRNLALLSLPALVIVILIATNDLHHLVWSSFRFEGTAVSPLYGEIFWVLVAYGYVLFLVDLIVLVWLFVRSPQNRWPVVFILVGQFVSRGAFLLERTAVIRTDLPLEMIWVAIEFLMYAIALFAFRILDPTSLARQTAIEQARAGMLVLDPQGRIVRLNPAAEKILGVAAKAARGKPIRELLPAYPAGPLDGDIEIETSLEADALTRDYVLAISRLNDWRGLEAGRLLMLHDITEQKKSNMQILAQQRALAILQERERLGRELHDSTGQVLGFASLKLGAARQLIADDQAAEADRQLEQLESAILEAHADLREYILNLRVTSPGEKTFFAALQHYLDGYCQNYGIQVDVSIGPGVDESLFDSEETRLQLFRILQEAFSNARKHAKTDCVQASFERENDLLRVRIQDSGQGFDPQQAAGRGGAHFGMQTMLERAEQLGGALRVQSAPGAGTCVVVEVPVKKGGADARIDR